MRDKDGNVAKVETPQEFLDKFTGSKWEYDYISEEEIELLEGWVREYIRLVKKIKPYDHSRKKKQMIETCCFHISSCEECQYSNINYRIGEVYCNQLAKVVYVLEHNNPDDEFYIHIPDECPLQDV